MKLWISGLGYDRAHQPCVRVLCGGVYEPDERTLLILDFRGQLSTYGLSCSVCGNRQSRYDWSEPRIL